MPQLQTKPNIDLLKDAYQVIDGIPAEKFNLDYIVDKGGKDLECGTIACAAGWLGLRPEFRKLGFKTEVNDFMCNVKMKGVPRKVNYTVHVAELFSITNYQASQLCDPAGLSDYDNALYRQNPELTDKDLFLGRVLAFIAEQEETV